ncbi:hypothetical protein MMC19_005268 [Ptychographa xylographoides]|nr:hypothetical protein [Ptychographa xylographoides]
MHLLSALAVSSGLILSSFALPLAPVSESLTSARAIGLEKRELSVQINVFYNEGCAGPVDEVLTFWLPYGDGCYSPDRANSWQFFPAPGTLAEVHQAGGPTVGLSLCYGDIQVVVPGDCYNGINWGAIGISGF